MEILTLILVYLLVCRPEFTKKVQPVMEKLKCSEDALKFLKDLSSFSDFFSSCASPKKGETKSETDQCAENGSDEKPNDFFERVLSPFLKNK